MASKAPLRLLRAAEAADMVLQPEQLVRLLEVPYESAVLLLLLLRRSTLARPAAAAAVDAASDALLLLLLL